MLTHIIRPNPRVVKADDSNHARANPDSIWDEAAKHYDEQGLAALVLMIAITNLFNRLNVTTKQMARRQSW